MAVGCDQCDREVRAQEAQDQQAEGERGEQALRDRDGADRTQVATGVRRGSHRGKPEIKLKQRQRRRQPQSRKPPFSDHRNVSVSCWPRAWRITGGT